MNISPLVSVVIIFFNGERFLQEAIESVFAQTYDNWELLLVDDGSQDSSTELALRHVEQYPDKVRYLEHEGHQNRGMSATRNLGIRHAKGEYIAFLDSDDVWLPDKLVQQVTLLQTQPEAALVYGVAQKWYSWTNNPEERPDKLYKLGLEPDSLIHPPELMTLVLQGTPTPGPSNFLFRRELAEQVNGFEETYTDIYQLYEDQAFLSKVYLQAPVWVAGEYWTKYRKHPDSHVARVREAGQADIVRLFFLNWLENYLIEHRVQNSKVWKALQKQLWPYRRPFLHKVSERVLMFPKIFKRLSKQFVSKFALKAHSSS